MLSPAASQYTTDFGSPVGDYDTTVQLVHMSQYTCNLNKFSGVHHSPGYYEGNRHKFNKIAQV